MYRPRRFASEQTHPHCAAIFPLVMFRSERTTNTCKEQRELVRVQK